MDLDILRNERFLLLVAVFIVFIAFASLGRYGTNPSSRFMLTKDLVLYHSLSLNKTDVDFYSGLDYSVLGGKYFSDKPPGFSMLAVPLYAAGDYLYKIGIVLPNTDTFNYGGDANAFFLMVIFIISVSAVGILKFYDVLRLLRFDKKASLLTTFIFAFGTLYFVFSYSMFLHSFVATLLILSTFYLLKNQKKDLIYSGIFFGFAILCEYTIVLILPLFILYLSRSNDFRKKLFHFMLPIVFALGLLGLYNWVAFGNPFIFSYDISTFKDTQKFDHPLFQGLYELLVSNWRGLFFFNPIFLLAIVGFFLFKNSSRKEAYLFAFIFLTYLFFYAPYRYLGGGLSYGPRHFVSILPFMGFLLAPCFDKKYYKKIYEIGINNRFFFAAIAILVAISFFHTFLGIYVTPFAAPEIDPNPIYTGGLVFLLRGEMNSYLQTHYALAYYALLLVAAVLFVKIFVDAFKSKS